MKLVQSAKFKTMSEQIDYVARGVELLDPPRLQYMQQRAKVLSEQVMILGSDAKEVKGLGHDKEEIDDLYETAVRVRELATAGGLERLVERLEQKRRVHDMSAKVVVDLERLQTQQRQIAGSVKEGSELLGMIREGLAANAEAIKRNLEHLRK